MVSPCPFVGLPLSEIVAVPLCAVSYLANHAFISALTILRILDLPAYYSRRFGRRRIGTCSW
jgi:hypothetical protein